MTMILGIDTGGTFTDGVIADRDRGEILCKAKALTTRNDLSEGMKACLEKLEFPKGKTINLVCLSTTLATNSVVEGKGAKVGLLTINPVAGDETWPAEEAFHLTGSMDIKGNEQIPLDLGEAARALDKMKGKVEALAVSGYASVRNPRHEIAVKRIAAERLKLPVVCGHELTGSLGYQERTVTAILNAKLISVIQDLVDKTKRILKEKGIKAPVVILKGDGHFMVDSFAEGRPIETVLSGPAASVIGATFLTDAKDALVVDIGGTTTDIANIRDGHVFLNEEGARVGDWQTKVKAIDIQTFGLGGDSCLTIEKETIRFGPQRVVPLCAAAEQAPYLADEIEQYRGKTGHEASQLQSYDCFRLLNTPKDEEYLAKQDKQLLNLLKDGPHSVYYLAEKIGRTIKYLRLNKLLQANLIQKISLTPTDLLHASGEYVEWKEEVSKLAAAVAAERLNLGTDDFISCGKQQFINQLAFALAKSMLIFESKGDKDLDYRLLQEGIFDRWGEHIAMNIVLKKPIIGLGAPAKAWLPEVSKKLNAPLILPENGDVANAIGTAAGNIRESVEALVKYDPDHLNYIVYGPWGRDEFLTIEEAVESARAKVHAHSEAIAKKEGMEAYQINIDEELQYEDTQNVSQWRLMESKITGVITGMPKCLEVVDR